MTEPEPARAVPKSWEIDGCAVVTGAGRGIGAAIAHRLAEQGAKVIVASLHEDHYEATVAAIRAEGHDALPCYVDVASEGSVEALADFAAQQGPIAAWVNNAGISERVPLTEMSVEQWDRMMGVNARGVFLGTRAAARRMERGGAIVNIASISSTIALPNLTHYGASKGAVASFTRHAAIELGPRGIRVNAVGPGTTRTEMTAPRLADPAQLQWTLNRVPLQRVAEPMDIAAVAAFLCSPAAAYVSGQLLMCDGGWSVAA